MSEAPRLETERLILRGHGETDLEALHAMWSDPGVARHTGGEPATRQDSWLRLLRYPGLWSLLGYGYWAIEEAASGRFVGEAGLADFKRDLTPPIGAVPEAGWALDPAFHGRGYAREAMGAILGWADACLYARELVAIIDPDNAPSIRLAAKLGFDGPEPALHRGRESGLYRRARR